MINLLIVEDQKMLLDALSNTLIKDEEIKVVGKLTDISLAYDFIKNNEVDVLLSDICTENDNNSLNFISNIKHDFENIKIIIMTGLPEVSYAERAKNNGADSFVYKNVSLEEMQTIIKNTYHGYNVFPTLSKNEKPLGNLSKQEMRVLRLFCEGYDRKEIAEVLSISENSVKFHIRNMLEKTQFPSMSRLAIYAISNRLIVLD